MPKYIKIEWSIRQSSILCRPDYKHFGLALAICLLWNHLCGPQARADPGSIEIGAKLAPSLEEFNGTRQAGENAYKLGASVGGSVHVGLIGPLGIQTEILYATRGTDVVLGDRTVGSFYLTYIEVPVLARVAWRIAGLASDGQRSPWSAHVVAGGAVSHLLGAVREDGSGTTDLDRNAMSSNDVSAVAGLGLTWDVTPHWAASFEVRYDHGFINAFQDTTDDRETKNRAIVFTFGVGYTVNDGDSDGVASSRDQCRTQPEDWNGFQDGDGCPDADDDTDGIRGEADKCPEKAEDVNEYEDEDGCPDGHKDKDRDGIADKDDKCVDDAFPYNKELENDRLGCPPELDLVSVEHGEIEVTPPLEFVFGQATLMPDHERVLAQVVVLLRDYYPDMKLIIAGHSDSKPGQKGRDNEVESKRRATAVLTYLVDTGGIDSNRLRIEARGDDNPRGDETPDGRQRSNRRVDLIIIENPKPPATPPQ